MFIDIAKVTVKSGNGGSGCVSFRREKFITNGGPNGGDGGRGGDVILVGDARINNLAAFRFSPRLVGENGRPGEGNNRTGRGGKSKTVKVPCGTILKNAETDEVVCEILEPDVPAIIVVGGKGGAGNQHFATSRNQAPRIAKDGKPGEGFKAIMELKVMADVGLLGLPNAGKSSLITAVSHARPKIADYPFTTLDPSVGVIELPDFRRIFMADIPGIIEGAAHGKGLGIKFLKHVERTKVLLFVLDVSGFAETPAMEAFDVLRKEIEEFGHGLKEKKFLVAINKVDLDPDKEAINKFIKEIDKDLSGRVYPISAATREGLDELVAALDKII
jgi:GTP-binding protein